VERALVLRLDEKELGEVTRRRLQHGKGSPAPSTRVAIYTRKSTEEGLDQEFNSLDNQRQAVEAYVESQRGEGWVALPDSYDDGGFTGANTDRPAFRRLMEDVEAGRMDIVAVYKIDRLSRSLTDFARIMETFERHGVTFVSITQQFSTTTSMGRLTLNILMSFAEFEREMISERTRDKIAASRRKGMWVGGRAVLGYDVKDKRLVVNRDAAAQVQEVFRIYLDHGSLLATVQELNRLGWRTRTRKAWDKGNLRALLTNVLLIGKVRYKDEIHEGVHDAIIDQETWDAVQRQLRQGARSTNAATRNKWGALLKGLVRCGACATGMTHHYTSKGSRRYRYYVCDTALKRGASACPGSRVAAIDLEAFVVDSIRAIGRDPALIAETLAAARREAQRRRPELEAEARRLEQERQRLVQDRENLIDAIAQSGSAAGTLARRVGETDELLARVVDRLAETRAELLATTRDTVDEADLAAALAAFDPVWDELIPREQARVLGLLIHAVTYDAAAAEVAITFHPGGVRDLASRNGRASA
jgi:site-specific DNA recombinase